MTIVDIRPGVRQPPPTRTRAPKGSKPSAFALRMPPEVKAAAVALSNAYFSELGPDMTYTGRMGGSVNEVLSELLFRGIEAFTPSLETAISEEERDVAGWLEIIAKVSHGGTVVRSDFPEGSPAWEMLVDDDEPIDRATAMRELAWRDQALSRRKAALEAMQRATAANPRPWRR